MPKGVGYGGNSTAKKKKNARDKAVRLGQKVLPKIRGGKKALNAMQRRRKMLQDI